MRVRFVLACLAIPCANACGLANAFGHADHPLYDDPLAICAWCHDSGDGFPCIVEDETASCSSRADLAGCAVAEPLLDDEPNDDDAPLLSPVGDFGEEGLRVEDSDYEGCPDLFPQSFTADFLLMHDDEPDPFDGEGDEEDLADLESMFSVGADREVIVVDASWERLDVPWPRKGYAAALSVTFCAMWLDDPSDKSRDVAVRAVAEDGTSNPVCIAPERGSAEE